jgi:hypothetical protein
VEAARDVVSSADDRITIAVKHAIVVVTEIFAEYLINISSICGSSDSDGAHAHIACSQVCVQSE